MKRTYSASARKADRVTRLLLQVGIFLMLLLVAPVAGRAQCSSVNTAFQAGELLRYDLYFNWKFVWVKVGTASMSISESIWQGQPAYRAYLITRGNSTADKLFVLRDTLTSFVSHDLTPLRHVKRAAEGKNYYREEVNYTYPKGRCRLEMNYSRNYLPWEHSIEESTQCAYDMVSMLLRARSFNPESWKPGHRVRFTMATGRRCEPESIVYRGKEVFKVESTGVKYRCLVFSFMEPQSGGGESEIVRFYITDDANHLPVRLDLNLRFGSAKAFLTMGRGIRNKQSARIK